jgi:poly(3-hydroxybutyrate) depolymerase
MAGVRMHLVRYRAHNGLARRAYVLAPDDVGPRNPVRLPLVVSPHGRGVTPLANARLWGDLPGRGRFAVVCPEGQGRKLVLYSWGWRGQVEDLARMRDVVHETLPWLRVNRDRVYVVGGSMGGQEALLVCARYPRRFAGAAAFDSVTDFARRYEQFPQIANGATLQRLARQEVGGTPRTNPRGYAERSPIAYASRLAHLSFPLQIWWSVADQIVVDQAHQSAALYDRIRALDPHADVEAVTGEWRHSAEMRATTQLPDALRRLGLLAPEV